MLVETWSFPLAAGPGSMGGTDVKTALRAIAKAQSSSADQLPYDDVPPELMVMQSIDLRTRVFRRARETIESKCVKKGGRSPRQRAKVVRACLLRRAPLSGRLTHEVFVETCLSLLEVVVFENRRFAAGRCS